MKHLLLCCLLFLAMLLAACSGDTGPPAGTNDSASRTVTVTSTFPALPAVLAKGTFHEYALPQTNSGMMRPAIDHEGRIWFGEMDRNYLAVFDPHTQHFQQMIPLQGRSGIMGIAVAADDTIWYAEQYANYIGHYVPSTGRYQLYPLPTITTPDPSNTNTLLTLPSAPNDLAFDSAGNLWFTELNADALGKLNIATGSIQQYPLTNTKSVQKLDPYGITVDSRGIVWFTEASSSRVGRLDPRSGTIQYFTMPGQSKSLMEIASDSTGMIWATTFDANLLLRLDPSSGTFTPYFASFAGNHAGGIYGLTILSPHEVWITIPEQNMLAHLDVAANRFIYYTIPTAASLPLGLVVGAQHTFWFTEVGSDKIGMLRP